MTWSITEAALVLFGVAVLIFALLYAFPRLAAWFVCRYGRFHIFVLSLLAALGGCGTTTGSDTHAGMVPTTPTLTSVCYDTNHLTGPPFPFRLTWSPIDGNRHRACAGHEPDWPDGGVGDLLTLIRWDLHVVPDVDTMVSSPSFISISSQVGAGQVLCFVLYAVAPDGTDSLPSNTVCTSAMSVCP